MISTRFRISRGVLPALLSCLLWRSPALHAASPAAPSGRGGAVASEHVLASEVGVSILRADGNAVDAAVAVALALAVVHPEAGNLGGGGFAVLRMKGEIQALDFREVGPAAAHRDLFLDSKGAPIPGASQAGGLAVGVPGTPTGLYELHRRYGRLPWRQVVTPAQKIAEEGFLVGRALNRSLAIPTTAPSSRVFQKRSAVWLPGGEPLPVGHLLRQPAWLAAGALRRRGPARAHRGHRRRRGGRDVLTPRRNPYPRRSFRLPPRMARASPIRAHGLELRHHAPAFFGRRDPRRRPVASRELALVGESTRRRRARSPPHRGIAPRLRGSNAAR